MHHHKRKRVGLALGGGGARGLAHIGVLSVLKEANIPIDYVAGTSIGSMVGAAYCAGIEIPQLIEIAADTGWWSISRPTWPRHGLLSFEKMEKWITELIGDVDIRDFSTPFAAVATDIETGERVILREGPVGKVIRASCSVPGAVSPLEYQGRLLCDGGISDNLPDFAARALGSRLCHWCGCLRTRFPLFLRSRGCIAGGHRNVGAACRWGRPGCRLPYHS